MLTTKPTNSGTQNKRPKGYEDYEEIPLPMPMILPQNDFMSRSRIIYFCTDFSSTAAKQVIERMLIMNAESQMDDITLIIDSQGGDVSSFFSIYDTMTKLIHCDVATVCLGQAMSAGQMLLMSGTKGKRFITENSKVLVHQLSSGTVGKVAEMQNHLTYVKQLDEAVCKLILKHTKIKKRELDIMMRKDTYLSAEEAVKLGIVDYVIHKPDDLYGRLSTKNMKVRGVIEEIAKGSKIEKIKK